ncbi:hypothetical protein GCM10010913_38130 [Paenibacillus aceti]|uniref:HAMP domain-containing protein n=1 Tax=Paenibacillus aceti TaxID=1820010 RepID=A0ABQ1W5N6_9BACL|nr:hypothetical protein GCM10010913_38130 [Paenibacillus aceti]
MVASIFLVRLIKKMTKATKQIAAGDFNVELNIKQKGELGTLARRLPPYPVMRKRSSM